MRLIYKLRLLKLLKFKELLKIFKKRLIFNFLLTFYKNKNIDQTRC